MSQTQQPTSVPTLDSGADVARTGSPAEAFVDLSTIDLTRNMLSRKDIEGFIPHRDIMLMLDGVVWHKPDWTLGVAVKHIRSDEFWTNGHIPGRPILPGVLMVEAGAQLASILYHARVKTDKFAGFTRIENTAFRGMVVPGDTLYFISREVKFSQRRFVADIQGIVDNKLVFESRVTGMLF